METENEKYQDQNSTNTNNDSAREGNGQQRQPRQRMRITQQRYGDRPQYGDRQQYGDRPRPMYNRNNNDAGFRPDGFGAALGAVENSDNAEEGTYRQHGGYNRQRTGYQPRGGYNQRQGGYRSNGGYNRQGTGYNSRQNGYGQQGGYNQRPYRPYNAGNNAEGAQEGNEYQQHNSYAQPRGGYNNRQGGYGNRQGGYQQRGGYGQQRGGYNNRQGGYGQQYGGYNNRQNGYGHRGHSADYDPNAKYSMKKRIEYNENNIDPTQPVRLNKYLANAGVCSRREADDFIEAGVVTVNGKVVTELGTKIMRTDEVKFHDQPVTLEKKVYVLLNKPKDCVTTSDDPQQRKTVMDLVRDACPERIYPVGRLDRNTTGVLLLTNDGDMASKLTHPKFLKKKVYHVHLDKNATLNDLRQIAEGITLDDGPIKADSIEYAHETDKKQVGIEIHSGKNRIVRRIFEHLGYKVTKLDRVQFAGLTKKNLRRGDWRFLTEKEVDMLRMGAYE